MRGVVVALALPMINRWQSNLEEAREESGEGMVGGQMSHIAELNSVLDATDPARFGRFPEGEDEETGGAAYRDMSDPSVALGGMSSMSDLPLAQADWSLEASSIPEGKANGSVSGEAFTVDAASVITGSRVPILALRQGTDRIPDREIMIYLRGQSLAGGNWTVAASDPAGGPQVLKRWRGADQSRLQMKTYRSGFALRLELGQPSGGILPGKIYLALPDPEQSVVAGQFRAEIQMAAVASGEGMGGAGGYGQGGGYGYGGGGQGQGGGRVGGGTRTMYSLPSRLRNQGNRGDGRPPGGEEY